MGVNNNTPERWNQDISESVATYNKWFIKFAPKTFRKVRDTTTGEVMQMMNSTNNLTGVSAQFLADNPDALSALRMSTCPPLAVDRLIGLAGVHANLVKKMEKKNLPKMMNKDKMFDDLKKISDLLMQMIDFDIFTWLKHHRTPSQEEIYRAATIVADRLCGARSNPIIRNAQEERQLGVIIKWLKNAGYVKVPSSEMDLMSKRITPGTFSIHRNIQAKHKDPYKQIKIPVDVIIMPRRETKDRVLPVLIEAKSAGDYTNVNKRRKEEVAKVEQLYDTYGKDVKLVLLLGGYFDTGYLRYEAASGIDWVWEHRIEDLRELGL